MDGNQLYPLEKVKSVVDFGVRFDSNLTFRDHISGRINKAYIVLGVIKRNFISMDEHTFILLFIKQLYVHTLNLQILFGVYSNLAILRRLRNSKRGL